MSDGYNYGYASPRSLPGNSVEFETLTTEPDWGKSEVAFDLLVRNKEGQIQRTAEGAPILDYWKTLSYFTRDLRLGNIVKSVHDPQFVWSYAELPAQIMLLRGGRLKPWALSTLATTVAMMETSQSLNGFFRKNARTFISDATSSHTENAGGGGGFFGKLFGGGAKNKNPGGY
jgi:hypothetical protein